MVLGPVASTPYRQAARNSQSAGTLDCGNQDGESFRESEPLTDRTYSPTKMSTTEKVCYGLGLTGGGAVGGFAAGLLVAHSASQLSALPYFAVAGGLCGCALAGVMMVGEG